MFKTSTLKFVYFQNFLEKQKCVYLRPKVPDWGIFGLHFKKLLSYLKSTSSYLSICNVSKKMRKLRTKSALVGDIWAKILKSYCHI